MTKRIFTVALLLSMALLFAPAQSNSQFNKIKFYHDSLPNGLHVIYNVDKSAPIVSTVVHYRVGSRDEDPNKTGYAHFFEHLMFEATENIERAKIPEYINEAGGSLNAYTSFDETVYFFTVPANEIRLALWMESQRMSKLLVDTAGVKTQKGVVIEELRMRTENQPYGSLLQKMLENVFKDGTYSWSTIGFIEDLQAAQVSDFREFYNNFYKPNNATLVISGDIDIPVVRQYVWDYFSILPKAEPPVREPMDVYPIKKPVKEKIVDEKVQLPGVFIGYQGPKMGDSLYYAFDLLSSIMSDGESSRMYRRLIDEDRIAVSADLSYISLQYAGLIFGVGIVSPGSKIADVEKAMLEELNKVIEDGVSDKELQKAKNIKEAQFVSGKKNVLEKARSLAQYYAYYQNPDLINTELDDFLAVTKDDIIKAAKQYLATNNKVTLYYVPKGYEE